MHYYYSTLKFYYNINQALRVSQLVGSFIFI
nr:MAG TPA: hypothetical protein [Caudoviricetes sp.]DAZ34031.1 MAG TPA: hypothetical protein [Caudoviricetes sp.]DAZ46056.1 MAG TPA: hypothetical protein [Caudoviricetes sp.]